jgi:hypothetical protein
MQNSKTSISSNINNRQIYKTKQQINKILFQNLALTMIALWSSETSGNTREMAERHNLRRLNLEQNRRENKIWRRNTSYQANKCTCMNVQSYTHFVNAPPPTKWSLKGDVFFTENITQKAAE